MVSWFFCHKLSKGSLFIIHLQPTHIRHYKPHDDVIHDVMQLIKIPLSVRLASHSLFSDWTGAGEKGLVTLGYSFRIWVEVIHGFFHVIQKLREVK